LANPTDAATTFAAPALALGSQAPPYPLAVLALDIPAVGEQDPYATFIKNPRAQLVDGAREAALALPSAPSDGALTVSIQLDGGEFLLTQDGYAQQGTERQPLREFCEETYTVFGWWGINTIKEQLLSVITADFQQQLSSETGALADDLLSIVQSIEIALSQQIADFLVTFETRALAELDAVLIKASEQVAGIRARYLGTPVKKGDPASLKTNDEGQVVDDVKSLREDVKVLLSVVDALKEHEMQFETLSDLSLIGRVMQTPIKLATMMTPPEPTDIADAFGGVLGTQLEKWFGEEIRDYTTGRNALLRALAQYLIGARKRHPIIDLLWARFYEMPQDSELAAGIEAVVSSVEEAIQSASALRDEGQLSALNREIGETEWSSESAPALDSPPVETPEMRGEGSRHGPTYSPAVASGEPSGKAPIFELSNFAQQIHPDEWLGGLLGGRGAVTSRLTDAKVSALPPVTVWDLDALFAVTLQRLLLEGRLGGIEQTSLRVLNSMIAWTERGSSLIDTVMLLTVDYGATVLISSEAAIGIAALINVFRVVYTAKRFSVLKVLADAEALVAISAARRIVSRDPSFFQLLAGLIAVVGDVAAILKLGALVKILLADQLLLALLDAGDAAPIEIDELLAMLPNQPAEPATAPARR